MNDKPKNYIVLARKYRPAKFTHLKGQDALVKIISGAIRKNRLAHAFLLSGIRGIGKTTTARIMAQLINCSEVSFNDNQIAEACQKCDNCINFNASSHPDIIEVDAASKTGIDDIREIIDNANYVPLIGKYKIYIIDEIHMLSKNAFNALLKTLEEPPGHVKFIFATTEMHKIPVTITSRCQSFSLRSLNSKDLIKLMSNIAENEKINIDDLALQMIANEGDGSVRDCLSLLDQASSNFSSNASHIISKDDIRQMIGYGSKVDICNLLQFIINADISPSLGLLNKIHQNGVDCTLIISDLMSIIHIVTRNKFIESLDAMPFSEEEKVILQNFNHCEVSLLAGIWQMLIKSVDEMRFAPNKLMCLEMIIIRLCHMSNLPPIEKIIKNLDLISDEKFSSNDLSSLKPQSYKKNEGHVDDIGEFEKFIELFNKNNEPIIYHYLKNNIRPIDFKVSGESGEFSYSIEPGCHVPKDFSRKLKSHLEGWTKISWNVYFGQQKGEDTISMQQEVKKEDLKKTLQQHEDIKKLLDLLPGSSIKDIKFLH